MINQSLKELISLSNEKLLHLKNILKLTEKQKKVIDNGNIEKLNEYIAQKQNEIDAIDKLDIKFIEIYNSIKKENNIASLEELNTEYHPLVKEIKNVVEEITNLLKFIQEIEGYNNETLKKEFIQVKAKLKGVKQGKKMVNAYNSYKKMSGSIFINKKK